jgi:hypothetical protein
MAAWTIWLGKRTFARRWYACPKPWRRRERCKQLIEGKLPDDGRLLLLDHLIPVPDG